MKFAVVNSNRWNHVGLIAIASPAHQPDVVAFVGTTHGSWQDVIQSHRSRLSSARDNQLGLDICRTGDSEEINPIRFLTTTSTTKAKLSSCSKLSFMNPDSIGAKLNCPQQGIVSFGSSLSGPCSLNLGFFDDIFHRK